MLSKVLPVWVLVCGLTACTPEPNGELPLFEIHTADQTGLDFSNDLTPTLDLNVFNFMYFYNGGGIAAADFNQDGLTDLYFTANSLPNKLFLNNGDLTFKDVTAQAGVEGPEGWTTGVTAVDINNDGMMDLYIGQMGEYRTISGRNQLFVCVAINDHGIPIFEERAAEYGLDLKGFATQAAFFDYDRDGDLDMYQMNFSVHQNGTFGQRKTFEGDIHPLSGDRLLRNDGGRFTDVSAASGIYSSVIGYGLGIVTSDINDDGWPDIYVGNDFHENDYLYLNQQDGTFKEVLTEQMQHTSRFSMGVDIADINNDGYSEIFSADMLPYDPYILKSSLGEDGFSVFQFKLGYGYNHQYARNNLQLNNGNGTFSEIGIHSGVYATDWSWAPLFIDFDNDGFRDLFVSNGIPKRMNDIDYVKFMSNDEVQDRIQYDAIQDTDLSLADKLPEIKLPNKLFLNQRDLTFLDIEPRVSNNMPGFSNGAVYADLDLDGDLDLVVNNIADPPFVYRNLSRENGSDHAYLRIDLEGAPDNRSAIGARVCVYRNTRVQTYENFTVRGYQSSVPPGFHVGLGQNPADIDSIKLTWPDGRYQHIRSGLQDTSLSLQWNASLPYGTTRPIAAQSRAQYAKQVNSQHGLSFVHNENPFIEFHREQLIPHMTSTEGPALATGDVNGDGLDDVFFGGAKHQRSAMYLQQQDGTFQHLRQEAFATDSLFEDVDARLVDLDNDSDLDLVVASGGNEFSKQDEPLKPRIYRNDGAGQLIRDHEALPDLYLTASCVLPADVNDDGFTDLFIGGRAVPWNYGITPRSYLLINDGTGVFSDRTSEYAADLAEVGLVKNGVWVDIDNDGDHDLILALEWGAVTLFENDKGQLRKNILEGTDGWWNFVLPADFDGDGDIDFIAGNLGLNSKLRASREKPVTMYISDFDDNGQIEQIITHYIGDQEVILPTYTEITAQIPELKKSILYARDFANATYARLFTEDQRRDAVRRVAYEFANSYFENNGDLSFARHDLPQRLQFAPLKTGAVYDFNGDNLLDAMLAGNFYESNIELGRYDADYGSVLLNDGRDFQSGTISLLGITGQIRQIRQVESGGRTLFVLARNDAESLLFEAIHRQKREGI